MLLIGVNGESFRDVLNKIATYALRGLRGGFLHTGGVERVVISLRSKFKAYALRHGT